MAIRFCDLGFHKHFDNDKDSICSNYIRLDQDGHYIALSTYRFGDDLISEKPIVLDTDFFINANDAFHQNRTIRYIPVIDSAGYFICFCGRDVEHEKLLENILELNVFNAIPKFDSVVSNGKRIVIWGMNEIAYYLHTFLCKQGIDHILVGEMWKYIDSNALSNYSPSKQDLNLLFEGNYALPVAEGALGLTSLEWLEEDLAPINDFYHHCCQYKDVLHHSETQDQIYKSLTSEAPISIARIGNTEISILKEYIERKNGVLAHYSYFWLDFLYNCCGFFSAKGKISENDVDKYAELTLKALKNTDFNICWGNDCLAAGLNFILDEFELAGSKRVSWDSFSTSACCYSKALSSSALLGKNILVISPFIDSIQLQYIKKNILHTGEHRLPNFNLILYKAPETQMGNTYGYSSWFDLYDKIISDILHINFDIALIGAGCYGFPLADAIKRSGKKAISLSSYLPNWFGIKMKRYCAYSPVNINWNSEWTFPIETPPKGYESIENGCYWR